MEARTIPQLSHFTDFLGAVKWSGGTAIVKDNKAVKKSGIRGGDNQDLQCT